MDARARRAEPVLGSSLIGGEQLGALLESVLGLDGRRGGFEGRRIGTGVESVDEALGGGLRRGSVVGVSGEVGTSMVAFDVGLSFSLLLLSSRVSPEHILPTPEPTDVSRFPQCS